MIPAVPVELSDAALTADVVDGLALVEKGLREAASTPNEMLAGAAQHLSLIHIFNPADLEVGVVSPGARPVWKLISGRLPDPSDPDQVLASFTLQQDEGVHLGTVIRVPFYAACLLYTSSRTRRSTSRAGCGRSWTARTSR